MTRLAALLRWVRRRSTVTGAVAAAGLSAFGAIMALRLWRADLHVPLQLDGDAIANLIVAKALIEHSWWTHVPELGAPFGLDLHDFAFGGDHLHVLVLKLLGELTGDPALAVNLLYLAGFPLAAVAAFLVLRWLGVGAAAAVVASVLFALTPYVFLRGEVHLTFALVFPVPLAAYLVLAVGRGTPLFTGRRRAALTVAICAIVASTGSFYFPAFTIFLLAVAGLGALVAARPGSAAMAAGAIGVIAVVCAINLAPSALYAIEHGRNPSVGQRGAWESELHGLKLAPLVLPVEGHRLRPLANARERYAQDSVPPAPSELHWTTLGGAATLGLLWLALVALAALVAPRSRLAGDPRERLLAVGAGAALLLGATGALGALFAFLVTPQLRGWNRISIFVAFFALAALALLLDRLVVRLRARPVLAVAALGGVLALGVADQTTNAYIPRYAEVSSAYRADESYVRAIEARLGRGASVLQMPYVPFPEAGLAAGHAGDYQLARPYLHSHGLRWSYGAMKGRPEDWASALGERRPEIFLAAAVAAGFTGLHVERSVYPDAGRGIEAQVAWLTGERVLVRADRQAGFFDLSAYARRLRAAHPPARLRALRAATLYPPRVRLPADEGDPGGSTRSMRAAAGVTKLELVGSDRAPELTISLSLRSRSASPARVTIAYPDGSRRVVFAGPRPILVEQDQRLTARRASLRLATTGDLDVRVELTPHAFRPFTPAARPTPSSERSRAPADH